MQREEGTDLAQLALSGPLSAGQLLAIAEGIQGALERLHRADVIYGDVKPGEPAHRAWAKGGAGRLRDPWPSLCGGSRAQRSISVPTPMPRWSSATRTPSSGSPGPILEAPL